MFRVDPAPSTNNLKKNDTQNVYKLNTIPISENGRKTCLLPEKISVKC